MNSTKKFAICVVIVAVVWAAKSEAADKGKPTVAVFDFGIAKAVTEKVTVETSRGREHAEIKKSYETSVLTDKFVTALTKSKKVTVVERKKMATLMKEAELSQAELTDPKKSMELGKLLGADYFLFGSLSMMDGSITRKRLPFGAGQQVMMEFVVGANIRIVETETGRIVAAESKKAKKEEKKINPADMPNEVPVEFQHEVFDQLVQKLVDSVMMTLFPVKVAAFTGDTAYLSRGQLEKNSRFEVLVLGEEIRDPDTGELLGQTETKLAVVLVTQPLEKLSKAQVVEWLSDQKKIRKGALCRPLDAKEKETKEKESD